MRRTFRETAFRQGSSRCHSLLVIANEVKQSSGAAVEGLDGLACGLP